jgi:hypothetical protein
MTDQKENIRYQYGERRIATIAKDGQFYDLKSFSNSRQASIDFADTLFKEMDRVPDQPEGVYQLRLKGLIGTDSVESCFRIEIKLEEGSYKIYMETTGDGLESKSNFSTSMVVGMKTYIQGNIAVWISAVFKQITDAIEEANVRILERITAEARENSKRRI